MIDCQACKLEKGMVKENIGRFPGFIRFIGMIVAAPSLLGMLISGMAIFHSLSTRGIEGGFFGMGIAVGFMMFAFSAVGGLLGWLLLMKKKVFKCTCCGFLLDRA